MSLRLGRNVRRFRRNESGAALVEFSLVMTFFLLLIFGIVEFSMLFFQWNSATKALQQGARLASVSNPVATNLRDMTGLVGGRIPGAEMPGFRIICRGGEITCNCTGDPCAGATYVLDATALQRIVRGRNLVCGRPTPETPAEEIPGMCDIFDRITEANVIVTYEQTGLGFAGRPGGPVPTITIELRNLTFGFIFLQGLMRLAPRAIPAMKTTATGEDMNSAAPPPAP